MTVTLELPDELPRNAQTLPRLLTEAYVLAEYNAGRISVSTVGQLLGLDAWSAEDFLQRHNAPMVWDEDDLGL